MPQGASFFEDVPLVEFIYLVFTRTPGGVRRRFRSLLLHPLSVVRYYFCPVLVVGWQQLGKEMHWGCDEIINK